MTKHRRLFIDVITHWPDIDDETLGLRAQATLLLSALISLEEALADVDERSASSQQRRRTERLTETVETMRELLQDRMRKPFTNGTDDGYCDTEARRLYRELIKRMTEWSEFACPEAVRYIRALAG